MHSSESSVDIDSTSASELSLLASEVFCDDENDRNPDKVIVNEVDNLGDTQTNAYSSSYPRVTFRLRHKAHAANRMQFDRVVVVIVVRKRRGCAREGGVLLLLEGADRQIG